MLQELVNVCCFLAWLACLAAFEVWSTKHWHGSEVRYADAVEQHMLCGAASFTACRGTSPLTGHVSGLPRDLLAKGDGEPATKDKPQSSGKCLRSACSRHALEDSPDSHHSCWPVKNTTAHAEGAC